MAHRRSNKSSKVPNVKLRPAAPASRGSKSQDIDQETHLPGWGVDSDQDTSAIDLCPRPFRNVVLCATGVDDKTTLFKMAIELGATSSNDLTDKVTHLLALEPGSAKYRCALENKVPIMHPSWVIESHKVWLKGDDVDFKESEIQHRLPAFSGITVCVSGIEDIHRRTEINRLVTQNGGKYVKNIERPVKVTHLLCASGNDETTEKMRYAEKFNQRREASIHVVWEEWFWDSLDFGGKFDEERYKVSSPPPPRRVQHEELRLATPPPPPSSTVPEDSLSYISSTRAATHDLLSGATNDEEEVVSVRRVPAEMLEMWGSILKPRGFEVMSGKLIRSPSKSQSVAAQGENGSKAHAREASPTRSKVRRNAMRRSVGADGGQPASVLSTLKRTESFAPVANDKAAPRQPFGRSVTPRRSSSYLTHSSALQSQTESIDSRRWLSAAEKGKGRMHDETMSPEASRSSALFAGLRFRALGEARGTTVKTAVEDCGGRVVSDDDDGEVDFIIVRLVSGTSLYQTEMDEMERTKYRTECWLERCIFDERICPPEEHVAFTPLKVKLPVLGAEHLSISYSGLDQSEVCWIGRLARAIGANVAPSLSRQSTHLLCPSGTGAKADKARQWGIPVVDMNWLCELATVGVIAPATVEDKPDNNRETPTDVDVNVSRRAKGKQRATDPIIKDITNELPSGTDQERKAMQESKPGSIDHENEVEAEDRAVFGLPNALLSEPLKRQSSAVTAIPLSQATTFTDETETEPGLPSERILVADSRQSSLAQLTTNIQADRVPSSESPSPVKLLPGSGSAPPSPSKMSVDTAKVLQKNVTSLLGKRLSTEDEGSDTGNPTGCKRSRPPTRTASGSRLELPLQVDPEVLPVPLQADRPNPAISAEIRPSGRPEDKSVRVTYEDPRQNAEKKKLMKLLTSQKREIWEEGDDGCGSGTGTSSKRKKQKKSTRGVGF
ncbi:uncharacterized protein LAESUDRAFT_701065 [Laetiporus sulphureus 93-53]|uniref:BRCT domain-containing protein n=1 Tax=Laetiporus sulphureus 93-53 TaxID=1314785 RepID=A0A165E320_9APHY|nr:uncharacterized protein LAESUDRAFT_701065 [Laetiporus sulphureus 93-53]KZT06146.1 hypothetical protein LAESUDRAFT_701065 [Laetiporus sulphureus 93-53]